MLKINVHTERWEIYMNGSKAQNKNGFTIIEVVLVLAIAALIFLMVFIALPALQRNQRDTQRKDDIGRTLTAVNNYQSNNRGKLPHQGTGSGSDTEKWNEFGEKYLKSADGEFEDPSEGEPYAFIVRTDTVQPNSDNNRGEIFVNADATCGDDGDVNTNAGTRKVALRIALEGGGVYCQSN